MVFRSKVKIYRKNVCKKKLFGVFNNKSNIITPDECDIELNEDEQLYIDMCVHCSHPIGQDAVCGVRKNELICYLNRVFEIDDDRYRTLYDIIKGQEPSPVILNVDVKEARNLPPMDTNGLSDSFCVMWLSSKQDEWIKSNIIPETLNPVWNESTCLTTNSIKSDIFNLSVWDSDAIESIREIMKKIIDVKTSWALKKYLKDIKQAMCEKNCNELIGSIQIPLKEIPTTGQMEWFKLQKPKCSSDLGEILLKFTFSSEKDNTETFHQHKRLFEKIVQNHVAMAVEHKTMWSGAFCKEAQIILRQHSIRCNLTKGQELLIKWTFYVDLYQRNLFDLSYAVETLNSFLQCQHNEIFTEEMTSIFHGSMKKFLSRCFTFIKNLNQLDRNDTAAELRSILNAMQIFRCYYKRTDDNTVMAEDMYDTFINDEDTTVCNILQNIIVTGARDWFIKLLSKQDDVQVTKHDNVSNDFTINIQAVASICVDLENSLRYHERIFNTYVGCAYSKILFIVYQYMVCDKIKPIVMTTLRTIKQINLTDHYVDANTNSHLLQQTVYVFELYLELEKIYKIAIQIFGTERKLKCFEISQFREWFFPGVSKWLDFTAYKARQWIVKAVDLEQFVTVYDFVKYTSSAVDIMFIFYEMKTSWRQIYLLHHQLDSCIYLVKMIETIAECFIHYADQLEIKLNNVTSFNNNPCQMVDERCFFTVNNVNYVYQHVRSFLIQLGREYKTTHLLDDGDDNHDEDERGNQLKPFVTKLLINLREKRNQLLRNLARNIFSHTMSLLIDSANSLHSENEQMDLFMIYLETKLIYLQEKLDSENFEYIIQAAWNMLYKLLYSCLKFGIKEGKPPKFFSNLRCILIILVDYFKLYVGDEERLNSMKQIETEICLYRMDSEQLIYRYYLNRREQQRTIVKPKNGLLAVRLTLSQNNLVIEVLNARNITPTDLNGYCDPFVTVQLLTPDTFSGVIFKTKVKQKTLFPLFEEKFTLTLKPDQQKLQNAMIMFTVEDEDFCCVKNDYVGECYLSFEEINKLNGRQVHLNLYRPSEFDSDEFKILRSRRNDQVARRFIKTEKMKL